MKHLPTAAVSVARRTKEMLVRNFDVSVDHAPQLRSCFKVDVGWEPVDALDLSLLVASLQTRLAVSICTLGVLVLGVLIIMVEPWSKPLLRGYYEAFYKGF